MSNRRKAKQKMPEPPLRPYPLFPGGTKDRLPPTPSWPDLGKYYSVGTMDITSFTTVLEDLMWISHTDYGLRPSANYCKITGTIKPPETAATWDEHVLGLSTRYGVIIRRLEEAGAVLLQMPELTITGNAGPLPREEGRKGRHEFACIEGKIIIELDTSPPQLPGTHAYKMFSFT